MEKKQALINAGAIVAVIAAALIFPAPAEGENREKGHGVIEIDVVQES